MATLRDSRSQKGFTLIELIVSVGIFAMVATLTIGSLLVLTFAERRVFAIQTGQDNLRYALETMGREIRAGTCYQSGGTSVGTVCSGGVKPAVANDCTDNTCFQFRNSLNQEVEYKFIQNGTTECGSVAGKPVNCIAKRTQTVGHSSFWDPSVAVFYPVTSTEVDVQRLDFRLIGESGGDLRQPRVTITIQSVTKGQNSQNVNIDVQTTVSQLKQDS